MKSNLPDDKATLSKLIDALSEIARGLLEIARAIASHAKSFGLNDYGDPSRALNEITQSIYRSGSGDLNVAASEIAAGLNAIAKALQKSNEKGDDVL